MRFVFAILMLLAVNTTLSASTVTITIVDADAEPLEGARVRVSDAEHRLGIEATADDDGRATLEDLPDGTIRLTVTADGHAKRVLTVTATVIADDFTVRLDRRHSEKP